MTQRLTPDICVIGAGSGGLTVAAAAAAFGVEVVLIERGKMGGDCLNYGCVPSKALIAAGKHAEAIRQASDFGVGIGAGEIRVDGQRVHDHVHEVIAAIAPNDSVERFRGLGVNVIEAEARFIDHDTVRAGEFEIAARRFVIATGSSPLVPPIPGLDDVEYLTNETLFDVKQRPAHLLVIGGGPIGMEMAQAHRRLGSQVTVVEGQIALGKEDPELTAIVLERLRVEGIRIIEGAKVTRIAPSARNGEASAGIELTCEDGDGASFKVDGSHLLVATGRKPNLEALDLPAAGVEFDRAGIKVGSNLKTSNRRIFAIGDIAGGLQFTHVAGYHAGLVVQQILFRLPASFRPALMPRVTFTDPELAHVGLTEAEARKEHGDRLEVLRFPYAENDRAQAERRTEGRIKVIADRRARILGASIVGAGAGEMINLWTLAVSKKMSLSDIRAYVPPYPTMTEIGKRAAITYYAPLTRNRWVRRLLGILRRFG
ncbi:dihydrolipoyl dehydrogenase family protein [Pseudohoeflea coraliihabitans]|uniref:FAD-dependent oxidoreductase n=1 Tax=Pseudohoeflea coraliihabitans TaxID=2860393 RepID=A0ABS6WNM0_9HYPH|nr:FAD-dependent oxidoreductase [Pseudohoeflea sp. DP4N28-3]MBW3097564.1 FAD-dependent oxidoreductase [Pseudohoeflea sp. DP4N28-3]